MSETNVRSCQIQQSPSVGFDVNHYVNFTAVYGPVKAGENWNPTLLDSAGLNTDQWLAFNTQLRFCKNICSNLTWLQLFPAVFLQCFLAPFLSSGCSEGNEWQCWYLICIKSIKSPFPSPAVIHSPLSSQEKIESRERKGICAGAVGRAREGFLVVEDVLAFPLSPPRAFFPYAVLPA